MIDLRLGDCLEIMKNIPDKSIDLVVTSPPYDNLRTYTGEQEWNQKVFEDIAFEIVRILKEGGIIVWIVGDATINGSETGTSFKQALYFKNWLNLHDTMIWSKGGFSAVGALKNRYAPVFEYMFIFTKGKIKTFNAIKDRKTKHGGEKAGGTVRQKDGTMKRMSKYMTINTFGQRFNIWEQSPHRQRGGHPAPFPIALIKDHINSWSNEGDIVLDPFMGSGTTGVACKNLNRNFIGIDISSKYFDIAKKRIEDATNQTKLL